MYWLTMHVLQPFTLCYLLAAGAVVGLWRSRRDLGRRWHFVALAFTMLTAVCTPAVAYFALGTLEWRYPPQADIPSVPLALVVLGGTVRLDDEDDGRTQLCEDSMVRCLHAARVYHRGPKRWVVVSGGKVSPSLPGPPLAQLMREFLVQLGVAEEDILVEDRSRTTYENAVKTRNLLREHDIENIILVTEATHLLRADLCFQREGFKVFPVGCNYRAIDLDWSVFDFVPSATAAANVDRVAHEWLGIVWYWYHRRI